MKIVFIGRVPVRYADMMRADLAPRHELLALASLRDAVEHAEFLAAADVVVSPALTPDLAALIPALRLFHTPMAGLDSVQLELLGPSVTVCNTYNHQVSIAEYVVMAMLVASRDLFAADRRIRNGRWEGSWMWGTLPTLRALEGQTLLVIGTGRIGQEVARRTRCFGMTNIGISRRPQTQIDGFAGLRSYAQLDDSLAEADFVLIACPLTSETRGLIGAAQFARMKPTAHLTNIGRGEVVEEQALFEALRDKTIGGAAIDVWYQYPKSPEESRLPSRFPFETLENVLMTPHCSGWTRQTVEGRVRDILENIRRLEAGEPLLHVVRGPERQPVAG